MQTFSLFFFNCNLKQYVCYSGCIGNLRRLSRFSLSKFQLGFHFSYSNKIKLHIEISFLVNSLYFQVTKLHFYWSL